MKSKRLKILYVITKGNWGGAQRYVFDLATTLSHSSHLGTSFEVAAICGAGEILPKKLAESGIRTIKIESLHRDINPLLDLKSLRELIKIFKDERPDIVHLNSPKISGLGAVASRITGVPKIIFTGHGWAWNEDRSLPSKILITILSWLTILLCHKTIAVSENTKNQIVRLPFIGKEKIVTIPTGISPITFEEKSAARMKIGGGSEKIWIGTIAELHKNKGLDILLEAFATINYESHNVGLYIIGEGEERKNLEKQIVSLGLSNRVRLIGFMEGAARLLKAFDVFVLPSRTEAFPYVLLEAGLAQLPVVASNVGGIPEVVHHLKTGLLVQPGNQKELAAALKLLITDSALVAEISQGIRKEVENNFSKDQMVEKTTFLYT